MKNALFYKFLTHQNALFCKFQHIRTPYFTHFGVFRTPYFASFRVFNQGRIFCLNKKLHQAAPYKIRKNMTKGRLFPIFPKC